MIKLSINEIKKAEETGAKPEGYFADIMQYAKFKNEKWIGLNTVDYDRLTKKYSPDRLTIEERLAVKGAYGTSHPLYNKEEAEKFLGKPEEPKGFGPGTELKKILKRFGIIAKPNCSCNKRANEMDEWGVELTIQRKDLVLSWLEEEAKKRKLPFFKTVGTMIINQAIKRAKKNQN